MPQRPGAAGCKVIVGKSSLSVAAGRPCWSAGVYGWLFAADDSDVL
jgi:hypothetical protein